MIEEWACRSIEIIVDDGNKKSQRFLHENANVADIFKIKIQKREWMSERASELKKVRTVKKSRKLDFLQWRIKYTQYPPFPEVFLFGFKVDLIAGTSFFELIMFVVCAGFLLELDFDFRRFPPRESLCSISDSSLDSWPRLPLASVTVPFSTLLILRGAVFEFAFRIASVDVAEIFCICLELELVSFSAAGLFASPFSVKSGETICSFIPPRSRSRVPVPLLWLFLSAHLERENWMLIGAVFAYIYIQRGYRTHEKTCEQSTATRKCPV